MTCTARTSVAERLLSDQDTRPPRAVPNGRSRRRTVPAQVVSAFLLVLAASSVASCTSSSATGSPASSGASTQTTTSGVSAAQSSAAASASPARSPGKPLSVPQNLVTSVRAWDAGRGGAALSVVSEQVGVALQAVGLRQYTAARGACTKLATGVAAARTAPPIPDAAMQQLYKTALTELEQGAAHCRTAISQRSGGGAYFKTQHDLAVLHQSTLVLSAGANDLYQATGEIKALRRH
jgi:hypothetical protein